MPFGLTQEQFSKYINPIIILLTSLLVIYELVQISDNPLFQIILFVCAIVLELIAQYDLGLALAHLRVTGPAWDWDIIKHKIIGGVLLFFFAWYAVIYAILAGIGFFKAELDSQEVVYQQVKAVNEVTTDRLATIKDTMAILNKQLDTEAKTGFGPRSQAAVEELKKLSTEQSELQKSLAKTSQSFKKVPKNLFRSLADVFKKSENFFKVLIFGTLIVMLYLGSILTAWRLKLTVTGEENNETTSSDPEETIPEETAAGEEMESNLDANTEELLAFIGAAYKPGGGRALHGDWVISQKTGIPVQRCAELKKILSKVTINGKPLVVRRQGGSEAQFSKEIVEERVKKGV
jgi:Co/Zn/Cd efflux system component